MAEPLIAIVGSIDKRRTDYDPPLRNVDKATEACEQLGRELALAGYRLLVYSSDANAFIEPAVVRGYVASQQAAERSIRIRYPQAIGDEATPSFPEQTKHPAVFDDDPDGHPNWQVSFFKSLKEVDGILLVGGANSALITGLVAQMYRIPLVTVATFGGSAQTVWALSVGTPATEAERKLMGLPNWQKESAARLIAILGSQRARLLAEEMERRQAESLDRKQALRKALAVALVFLLAVVFTGLGMFSSSSSWLLFSILFFGTPLLAGAAGGLARNLSDLYRGAPQNPAHRDSLALSLGMLAGFLAVLLFVLAQSASNPDLLDMSKGIQKGLRALLPFELIVGFIAGLTLDTVFAKLQQTKVLTTGPVATKGD
jgi:hypothetical protein